MNSSGHSVKVQTDLKQVSVGTAESACGTREVIVCIRKVKRGIFRCYCLVSVSTCGGKGRMRAGA